MYLVRVPMFLAIGTRKFTKGGFERSSASFNVEDDNVDLSGKFVVITGANQGLGYAASREFARKKCNLVMVCRDRVRGQEALNNISKESGNPNIRLMICDTSSLKSINDFAAEYTASGDPLDVLVNNAGVMKPFEKSVDGYELNFATNTLGYYALTKAVEPALKKSSSARVIFVSSGGALTEPLIVDDLEGESIQSKSNFPESQYARDKRRQLAICEGLARGWADTNISIYAMHPGWCDTSGVRTSMPDFYSRFKNSLRTIEQGANTIVWLGLVDKARLVSGEFYLDRSVQSKHLPLGGTGYSESDVTKLMAKLEIYAKRISSE